MAEPSLLNKFASLFTGYSDSYVKHTPPFTKEESGKTMAKFTGLAEYKTHSHFHPTPPDGYSDGDKIPVTIDRYRDHLNGIEGLAISPLFQNSAGTDVVLYGIIDIDVYETNYTDLIQRLYAAGYKFGAFQSKSRGLHLYFFFKDEEPAKKVKEALDKIVEVWGLNKAFVTNKGRSRVETFPEHTTRSPGMHDKATMLPFFDSASGNSMNRLISADGVLLGIQKAIPVIETMWTSVKDIIKVTESLPYADAPYCVQSLLLNGTLGENSGRNDFLFTAAIYLKLRDGQNLEKSGIEEMNQHLETPLEQKEVDSIFSSVSGKDFQLAGRCKKEPMCSVCDRQLCKLRVHGVGKPKGNTSNNVEFGKVYRYLAEEPYYMLEARMSGTENYKMLRIDGAENLLNQRPIQKACIDVLGQTMVAIKQSFWEDRLNEILQDLEEIEVAKATDTTEMGELKQLFERFLTHRQDRHRKPQLIFAKQVYFELDTYYFKTDGLQDYLRAMKFNLGRTNLREQLLSYGCKEGSLTYQTGNGTEKTIECWCKVQDQSLVKLTTYFEDVLEADATVLKENVLNKQDAYETGNEPEERF